ncbi:MAG: nickel-dependent lactate racemase [bacterium]|jgi:nickel-dependent lactate racemase
MSYGRKGLPIELPNDWNVTVVSKPNMPVQFNPSEAIRTALANPTGSKTLIEEARGCKSACIVICDITRPVPNNLFLPIIIDELLAGGLQPDAITILIATGLHRPNIGDEVKELIGDEWVLKTVKIVNHFAENDDSHVDLGTTTRGTPIRIDRRLVEADLRILTGLVEPHLMAGYSGGRKLIAPGVAHAQTISSLHSARFLANPLADNCILDGNPVHQDQLEILAKVGKCLALNTVIDENRRLSYVSFGDTVESHLEAVRYVDRYAKISLPRKYKTIITSTAGYPLDKTFYQTVKGAVGPLGVLEQGGNLFVVSECSEGLGSKGFVSCQKRLVAKGVDGFLAEIMPKQFADNDEWGTQCLIRAMQRGNIYLYSEGLSEKDRKLTGVHVIDNLEEAIRKSVEETGDKNVVVIPEGPYAVPVSE